MGVTSAAGLTVGEGVSQCQGCVGVACAAGLTVWERVSVSVRGVWVWVLRVAASL